MALSFSKEPVFQLPHLFHEELESTTLVLNSSPWSKMFQTVPTSSHPLALVVFSHCFFLTLSFLVDPLHNFPAPCPISCQQRFFSFIWAAFLQETPPPNCLCFRLSCIRLMIALSAEICQNKLHLLSMLILIFSESNEYNLFTVEFQEYRNYIKGNSLPVFPCPSE